MGTNRKTDETGALKLEALNRMADAIHDYEEDVIHNRIPKRNITGEEDWFPRAIVTLQNMAKRTLREYGFSDQEADVQDLVSTTLGKARRFKRKNPAKRAIFKSLMQQVVIDRWRKEERLRKKNITTTAYDENAQGVEMDGELKEYLGLIQQNHNNRDHRQDRDPAAELAEHIKPCLSKLDQQDYRMIVLRFGFAPSGNGQKHSQQEIAKIVGISQQTVSNRLKAALQQIRECIEAALQETDQ